MTRRYAGFVLVAAAIVTTLCVVPYPAQARSSTCRAASKARSVRIVAHDKVAVVFTVGGDLHGCTYGGRVFKLKAICCEGERVTLGGRFVAYSYQGSAIGDETSKVGLYDLRTGKRVRIAKVDPSGEGPDPEIETYSLVRALAVTSRGAFAWLFDRVDADGNPTGGYELRVADSIPLSERAVDTGKIDPRSVRFSRDERSLLYRKDGANVSMALRPS